MVLWVEPSISMLSSPPVCETLTTASPACAESVNQSAPVTEAIPAAAAKSTRLLIPTYTLSHFTPQSKGWCGHRSHALYRFVPNGASRSRIPRGRGPGRSRAHDGAFARAARGRRRDPPRPPDPGDGPGRRPCGCRARLRRQAAGRPGHAPARDRAADGRPGARRQERRPPEGRRPVRVRARRGGGGGASGGGDRLRGGPGRHVGRCRPRVRGHPGHPPRRRRARWRSSPGTRTRPRRRARSTGTPSPSSPAPWSSTWASGAPRRSRKALIDAGRDPAEPAAAVERGTLPEQRSVVSTLGELAGGSGRGRAAPAGDPPRRRRRGEGGCDRLA